MNVRVELVAREVPAEAAGSSPRISGTGSKHTSRVTLGRTHFESNVKKCCKINKFHVFIVILEQDVAKLSSLWRSAPAKPRKHVGHGAQAKLKQWVNFGD